MNNPALRMASTTGSGPGAANAGKKGLRKRLPRFKRRNPLKRLDSNKEMQRSGAGPSERNGHAPKKIKRIDRTNVSACEAAKPTPSKGKAPQRHMRRAHVLPLIAYCTPAAAEGSNTH
jgi:hypothetical protein